MMDEFEFTKMHGAGNDFVMVDDMESVFSESVGLIRSLCDSHRGIGADGVIILRSSEEADFEMRYYNSDGSEAAMCGNGARCAALFAYTRGIAGRTIRFITGAGEVEAEIIEGNVKISIGAVSGLRLGIELAEGLEAGFAISGVPHTAVLVSDVDSIENSSFVKSASSIRYAEIFSPEGTNVNFVTALSPHRVSYRTYERGVEAETLACGTGAVGISVILAHMGLVSSPVECETSGGDILEVAFEITGDGAVGCTLTGPVRTAFRGSARISDYDSADG